MGGGAGPAPQDPFAIADLLQIPDTVRRVAAFVLKGRTAEDLPREILDTVPVPAEERRLC
jgi:hypothetical protein